MGLWTKLKDLVLGEPIEDEYDAPHRRAGGRRPVPPSPPVYPARGRWCWCARPLCGGGQNCRLPLRGTVLLDLEEVLRRPTAGSWTSSAARPTPGTGGCCR